MESSFSGGWLTAVIEPLAARLGDGLTLCRDGNSVRWGFAGQATVVELLTDGRMRATFVDREGIDEISNRPAVAAYRTHAPYALTAVSCARMVADMVDFFSGEREPKFRFFDAFPL